MPRQGSGWGIMPGNKFVVRSSCDRPKRRAIWLRYEFGGAEKSNSYVDTSAAVGSNTETIVPLCRALSIFNCAPCACAICLTMARPNPVPPISRDRALSTR